MISVFVDTSIFISEKYNIYSGSLAYLARSIDLGLVNLLTSSVVVDEVKRHIEDDCNTVAEKTKSLLGRVVPNQLFGYESPFERVKAKLLSDFDEYMRRAILIPLATISVEKLFDDYFHEILPFEPGRKKCEFPDAVIVQSIKNYSSVNQDSVCVVVKDDGFARSFNENDNVQVFGSLREFLTSIPKDEMLKSACIECLNNQRQEIENEVRLFLENVEWTYILESMNSCRETDGVNSADVTEICVERRGFSLVDVDNGRAIANMLAQSTVQVDYEFVDHSDEWHDEGDTYGTKTGCATGELKVSIEFELELSLELDDNEFDCEIHKYDFSDIDRRKVREGRFSEVIYEDDY